MVLPPILGATALEVLELISPQSEADPVNVLPLLVAALAAFASGWWACRTMIELVKRNGLGGFAVYCSVAGLLALILTR